MTYPGPDAPSTPGEQPAGATAAQPAAETPAEKSGAKKWLPIAGSVAVAGVLGTGALTGWFGIGDPKVGDCGQSKGATSFEVVDCDADGAEFKIIGIEDEELTWPDFEEAATAEAICQAFPSWEVALWTGELETDPGTIYCAESL
jgi:hypothetical protein